MDIYKKVQYRISYGNLFESVSDQLCTYNVYPANTMAIVCCAKTYGYLLNTFLKDIIDLSIEALDKVFLTRLELTVTTCMIFFTY